MRISTQTFFQRNTSTILDRQARTSQLNVHLTEGKRVLHAADDPVAAASIQRLKQSVSVNTQYLKNIEVADAANAQEESTLAQMVNLLQRTRELLVSAGDGIYSVENFETVAKELEQLKEQLIGLGNTRDGNSEYIFSGYDVDSKPFQINQFGTVEYFGDKGVRQLQVGSGVDAAINDSGFDVFMNLPSGNGSFKSTLGSGNTGSGVVEQGVVFDPSTASSFTGEEYSIHFTDPGAGLPTQYSVYSIEAATVTGAATVKLTGVDLNNAAIATVDPASVFPNAGSAVNVGYIVAPTLGEFYVTINGVSSLPVTYDSNVATAQEISINGMKVEIEGIPVVSDIYQINKYTAPTQYLENQAIEVNGVSTQIKGQPLDLDHFTLSPSINTDIFSTIQSAIDALRLPGATDTQEAERLTRINMAQLELDNAMGIVVSTRSKVGARMQTLSNQSEIGQDFKLVSQSAMSNLEDLDMAQAISDLKMEQTALEVAQQTFVQLQRLNLFDLIR
ncbi:MAG: flagellar hook-associated protein FlgL [Alteromonadaceae bacterium]|nr:flagellar hook-associated protein FlgL [Alteromonadaceae bacterium]